MKAANMPVSEISLHLLEKLFAQFNHFFDINSINSQQNKFQFEQEYYYIDFVIGANCFYEKIFLINLRAFQTYY